MDILRKDFRSLLTALSRIHCHRPRFFRQLSISASRKRSFSSRRRTTASTIDTTTTATKTSPLIEQNSVDMTSQAKPTVQSQLSGKTLETSAIGPGASSSSKLTPVKALEIPAIKERFRTSREYYVRPDSVLVQARLADPEKDTKNPLITWIVDHKGRLLAETIKNFTVDELKQGIAILRYPNPIASYPQETYNEWYVTREKFEKQYKVGDVEGGKELSGEYTPFESRVTTRKEGITIDEEVIKLLGGEDGLALVAPPWGGEMYAVLEGLLTAEGSCIGPEIVRVYYEKQNGPLSEA